MHWLSGWRVLVCDFQGGEQDDEFALDEDDDRGDGRQRGRSRAVKVTGSIRKVKGEKDPW